METIRETLNQFFDKISAWVDANVIKVLENITNFAKSNQTIFAVLAVFVALVLLIGILTWLFKGFKSFIIIVIIFGIVFGLAIFANGGIKQGVVESIAALLL